jgi:hypothetical protein
MINDEKFDEVLTLIAKEQDRLMRDKHYKVGPAWNLACEKVAQQLGMETADMKSQLKSLREKWRRELQPISWDTIASESNQGELARRQAWHTNRELYEAVLKILFSHDPIGICFHDAGATEYCPEVDTILPRLKVVRSESDVRTIIGEEFTRWFGKAANHATLKFDPIASEIWALLQNYSA